MSKSKAIVYISEEDFEDYGFEKPKDPEKFEEIANYVRKYLEESFSKALHDACSFYNIKRSN